MDIPFKIKFRFDTIDHSLNKEEKGLRLSEIKDILAVIDEMDGNDYDDEFILNEISGNCYQMTFLTLSENNYNSLLSISYNAINGDSSELSTIEKKFRRALNKSLNKEGRLLKIFDRDNKAILKTGKIEIQKEYKSFLRKTTITGIIARIGDQDLDKSYIHIKGYSSPIKINDAQDSALKEHYRNSKIRAIISQKINLETNKVSASTLESFSILTQGTLLDNLKGLSNTTLSKFKFKSNDDIIDALNGRPN